MDMNHRLFRYLSRDILKGLGIFWAVMFIVNILANVALHFMTSDVVLGPMISNGEVFSFAGSNIFSLFIFFIIYGIIIYYENFSLAGSFGVTRKNFYLHVILNNVIVVSISALIQILLLKIDTMVISKLGYEPMTEFGLFNSNDNIILNILLLGFVFLVFSSLTNLIGVFQYRFGAKFWIAFGIFVFVMTLFTNFIPMIFQGLFELANVIASGGFIIGIVVILISYAIGFILIRRVNVR